MDIVTRLETEADRAGISGDAPRAHLLRDAAAEIRLLQRKVRYAEDQVHPPIGAGPR